MFCFCLQSIARFISPSSTRTRPTSTHIGWRVKGHFPETFKSQLEKKNKNVIHRRGSVRIVRNCALGLSTAPGCTQDLGHSFSQYGSDFSAGK